MLKQLFQKSIFLGFMLSLITTSIPALATINDAEAINKAGRQRMLSQRIAKLYIASAWGIRDEAVSSGLDTAIIEFDGALKTLRQSALNSAEINKKLTKVQNQWDFTNAGFKISDQGQFVPNMVSVTTESILKKMNDLTYDYEQLMIKSNI